MRSGKNDHFPQAIVWHNINGQNGGTRDFLCASLLISFKGENSKGYDTSCRTCMVFQARAMRGTRPECAICLFNMQI